VAELIVRLGEWGFFNRWFRRSDVSDETIAALGDSFDETGMIGGVFEGVAEFVYPFVETVVVVNERVVRPQALAELVASNDLARMFEKQGQNLEWLVL